MLSAARGAFALRGRRECVATSKKRNHFMSFYFIFSLFYLHLFPVSPHSFPFDSPYYTTPVSQNLRFWNPISSYILDLTRPIKLECTFSRFNTQNYEFCGQFSIFGIFTQSVPVKMRLIAPLPPFASCNRLTGPRPLIWVPCAYRALGP